MKNNTMEKLYKCHQCDYESVHANLLKIHSKTHTGEKTNKCNQCNYASISAVTLRRHLKIHSGENSYKCNQCDFASFWDAALRRHFDNLRSHAGNNYKNSITETSHNKRRLFEEYIVSRKG